MKFLGLWIAVLTIFLSGCASIEQKCMKDANENATESMRRAYFNSCVETKRQGKSSSPIAAFFKGASEGYNKNRQTINCTSSNLGNTTYTNCN